MENPTDLAREIARLLVSDPIAASQVKEFVKEERLCELLEISPELVVKEVPADVDDEVSGDDAALQRVVKRFTKAQVLEAFRK